MVYPMVYHALVKLMVNVVLNFFCPKKFALYVKICYNRSGSKDKICMQVVNHKVNPSG